MSKLSEKSQSTRLAEPERQWLEAYIEETGVDQSTVVRASVRLLRLVTKRMEDYQRIRFIAQLAKLEPDAAAEAEAEVWAAAAIAAMKQAEATAADKPARPEAGR